jgi:hypothetical protein
MPERCTKVGYLSKHEAKAALRQAQRNGNAWRHEWRVYRCNGDDGLIPCGRATWHLTSTPHPDWGGP